MTVNLKNVSGEARYLGRSEGRRVEDGQVIHVEGKLAKTQPGDAYLIGEGDDARLYPHSLWKNAGGSGTAEPDVAAPSKENE